MMPHLLPTVIVVDRCWWHDKPGLELVVFTVAGRLYEAAVGHNTYPTVYETDDDGEAVRDMALTGGWVWQETGVYV